MKKRTDHEEKMFGVIKNLLLYANSNPHKTIKEIAADLGMGPLWVGNILRGKHYRELTRETGIPILYKIRKGGHINRTLLSKYELEWVVSIVNTSNTIAEALAENYHDPTRNEAARKWMDVVIGTLWQLKQEKERFLL